MAEGTAVAAALERRLPLGIPGLDEIFLGGLIPRRSYLLAGQPGAGKTIFAFQWLREMQRQGLRTLYISLAEAGGEIRRNMAAFGWDLAGIELLDLTPHDELDDAATGDYRIFAPSEVEEASGWGAIFRAVKAKRPECLVIDSLTHLRYLSPDEFQFRKKVLSLVSFLGRSQCTAFLTFEVSELEQESGVAMAVDGLIRLRCDVSRSRVVTLRSVQIDKFRGSDFLSGFHAMRITPAGIVVFPHRVEHTGPERICDSQLSSGSGELDELLGGGLETHTTTIISGPPGSGKTTLGVEFLRMAAEAGQRAVLFCFEESVESIVYRARTIGAPLDALLASGSMQILRTNLLEQYPDEFLAQVRLAVERDGASIVMFDSLRGYQLEMEQFGSPLSHIHNLIHYLRRKGVTCLMINEYESITGDVQATELGISHLAENIILMRYAEHQERIIKVITCLKKRGGRFQSELRELHIGPDGFNVGGKLDQLHGVLPGVPSWQPTK